MSSDNTHLENAPFKIWIFEWHVVIPFIPAGFFFDSSYVLAGLVYALFLAITHIAGIRVANTIMAMVARLKGGKCHSRKKSYR